MRVFIIFELAVIFVLLYFAVNLMRYFMFKQSEGKGGIFGLSDRWIENEKKRDVDVKKEKK